MNFSARRTVHALLALLSAHGAAGWVSISQSRFGGQIADIAAQLRGETTEAAPHYQKKLVRRGAPCVWEGGWNHGGVLPLWGARRGEEGGRSTHRRGTHRHYQKKLVSLGAPCWRGSGGRRDARVRTRVAAVPWSARPARAAQGGRPRLPRPDSVCLL